MTDKSNFTADEWKLLLESVMMAGVAISAAEPSGLWGLLKESFASGNALMTAKRAVCSMPRATPSKLRVHLGRIGGPWDASWCRIRHRLEDCSLVPDFPQVKDLNQEMAANLSHWGCGN